MPRTSRPTMKRRARMPRERARGSLAHNAARFAQDQEEDEPKGKVRFDGLEEDGFLIPEDDQSCEREVAGLNALPPDVAAAQAARKKAILADTVRPARSRERWSLTGTAG
jgi:hypothetical protein